MKNDTNSSESINRGLAGVVFDRTELTEIDGTQGELRHCGYSIGDIAATPCFESMCHLLLFKEWPAYQQKKIFSQLISDQRELSSSVIRLLDMMKDIKPEIALQTALSFIGGEDKKHGSGDYRQDLISLIAKIPSIIATHHALRLGREVMPSEPTLNHATDFLRRLTCRHLTDLEARLINLDFVLHADHGANASSFTARVVTSTRGKPTAAVVAALAAFSGELHGGAIEGVTKMLEKVGGPKAASAFVQEQMLAKTPPMGFGHRVYRTEDPRSHHYRDAAKQLSDEKNDRRLYETVEALINAMKPYRRFGLSPNVDLYAAVVYRLLGLSDDLTTVSFAASRIAGWSAQILEQHANNILIRPRLQYAGPNERVLPR